ncbi:MAG: hypothetical protein RIS47_688 [Bacteroidota bacterium]|jgi:hypothetical protein
MKRTTIYTFLTLAIAAIVFVGACNKDDVSKDLEVKVDYDLTQTSFDLAFVDAKTGEPIGFGDSKKVKLTFFGDDAKDIIDVLGANIDSYQTDKGFYSLALNPKRVPSAATPLKLNVKAECEGYLTNTFTFAATDTGRFVQQFKLVNKDNLPAGVSYKEVTLTATNGVVASQTSFTSTNLLQEVVIPAGITLKTATGELLNGTITAKLFSFDSTDPSVLEYYPGGLLARLEDNQEGMFHTAGFFSLELIDGSGKSAHILENGEIEVKSYMDSQTNKPSNAAVQIGDEIGLWSYDYSTALWKNDGTYTIEGTATPGKKSADKFIRARMRHLTPYNMDWFTPRTMCFGNSSFTFKAASSATTAVYFAQKMLVRRKSDNSILSSSWFIGLLNKPIKIYGIYPSDTDVKYEFPASNNLFTANGTVESKNACSGTFEVPITLKTNADRKSVKFRIVGRCSSKQLEVRPSLGFWYRLKSASWTAEPISFTYARAGVGMLENIKLNSEYEFLTFYNGEVFYSTYVITSENYNKEIEIPTWLCDKL